MCPDEPVGAGAADKEGPSQQPECSGLRCKPQRGESLTQWIPLVSGRRFDGFATPRRDTHVHGTFTHKQTENQDECYREARQDVRADAPVSVLDQRTEHGQKYELTGGITRCENADYRAAIFHKPAVSHRRAER